MKLTQQTGVQVLLFIGAALATLGVLYGLVLGLGLLPPKQVTMAAGEAGSAYYRIASLYQDALAKDGIELKIIETAGSMDNQRLMDDATSDVDIALIQGGVTASNPDLNALAAVFPEPLLVFASRTSGVDGNPHSWTGKRVALGAQGSGTQAVTQRLAEVTRAPALQERPGNLAQLLGGAAAAEALLQGELDLAFFVAPLDAPYLQALYASPDLVILPLAHARALGSQVAEAHHVPLFDGAIRYEPAYPPETLELVTLVAKLVARDDLHPAIVNRLVHAMTRVHGQREVLVMEPGFPNTELLDMPADVYSAKLLREGFNPLEQFLPYWVVAQINRFALLLLPMVFLLLPMFKILPALLDWRMQSRIYRYYDRLHEMDSTLSGPQPPTLSPEEAASMERELDEIEDGLRTLSVPLKYRKSAYTATEHVGLVRKRVHECR